MFAAFLDTICDPDAVALLEVFQWMLNQPECPLDAVNSDGQTAGDYLSGSGAHFARPLAMLQAAQAARARWTVLRAAWTGAVGAVASFTAVGAPGTW